MLLNIYLATVVVSFATTSLFRVAFKQKIKREGYVSTNKADKKSIFENIVGSTSIVIMNLIPIYNVCLTMYLLYGGTNILNEMTKNDIKKGKIIHTSKQVTENSTKDFKEKTTTANALELEAIPVMSLDYSYEKPFSEMTAEEKVEALLKEREFLLNSCNALLEQDMKKIKQ